ncbi:MAG: zinc ribbon domain-containing protein [Lachnospiraceae bacterium]|nr:zinc ribbon domain-containing protein [Lachnospiraceae bacterium]
MDEVIFWLIVAVLVAAFVSLVYHSVKYVKVRNALLDRAEVRSEAEKEASKIKLKDPMITCDYCGAKIDTRREKTCPKCGASYDKDSEWLARHDIDSKKMEKMSGGIFSKLKGNYLLRKEPELRKLRRGIIISAIPLAAALCLLIGTMVINRVFDYRTDEKLNKDATSRYVEADYRLDGDGVIFNQGDVRVTINGFYVQDLPKLPAGDSASAERVKVGLIVENRRNEKIDVILECSSINGVSAFYSGIFFSNRFKSKSETQIYEEFYSVPAGKISEMVITELEVRDSDYNRIGKIEKPIVIKTTAEDLPEQAKPDGRIVFTNDSVDIYFGRVENPYDDIPKYTFSIVNKTETTLNFSNEGCRLGGKEVRAYVISGCDIPAGYTFISGRERVFQENSDDTLQMSFSFKVPEDMSKSFSTGYFDAEK